MIPGAIRMIYRAAFWDRKLLSWMDADECNVMLEEDKHDNIWACLAPNSTEVVSPPGGYIFAPYVPLIISKPLEYIKIDFEVTNDSGSFK